MGHYFNCCFLLLLSTLSAQGVAVVFQPILAGEALRVTEEGAAAGTGKVVAALRFYLSDLVLLSEGRVVSTSSKRHHLLDAARPGTMRLPLSLPEGVTYNELRFTLGVDSLTAASGAFGADLDPTNGMYWTWRSGYINFKLEGSAPECPARQQRFQFHVGGFQEPFNSEREVRLEVYPSPEISVQINLDLFFEQTDLSKEYQVMSPNEEAMRVADRVMALFNVTAASISER